MISNFYPTLTAAVVQYGESGKKFRQWAHCKHSDVAFLIWVLSERNYTGDMVHSAGEWREKGESVDDPQPGDLVFFQQGRLKVGFYVNRIGQVVHVITAGVRVEAVGIVKHKIKGYRRGL